MEGNASVMAMYEKDIKETHNQKKDLVGLVVLLSVIIILMVL